MLVQRRRLWANVEPALAERLVFSWRNLSSGRDVLLAVIYAACHLICHPSKQKTFVYTLYNVGPTSKMLGRRCTHGMQMFCVCWDGPTLYKPTCHLGQRL